MSLQLLDITRLGHRKRILASLKPSVANGLISSQESTETNVEQSHSEDCVRLRHDNQVWDKYADVLLVVLIVNDSVHRGAVFMAKPL